MPGRPGARNMPKLDRHSIVPADIRGCQANDTHSTTHHLDQSPHPGYGKDRSHPNSEFPIREVAPVHSKAPDCSPGPAQVPGPARGNHLGSAGQTGSRSIAALERDGGSVPPGSQPLAGTA
eukprot:1197654-Amphidinium_carterae.1